jgi:hypothetical protein
MSDPTASYAKTILYRLYSWPKQRSKRTPQNVQIMNEKEPLALGGVQAYGPQIKIAVYAAEPANLLVRMIWTGTHRAIKEEILYLPAGLTVLCHCDLWKHTAQKRHFYADSPGFHLQTVPSPGKEILFMILFRHITLQEICRANLAFNFQTEDEYNKVLPKPFLNQVMLLEKIACTKRQRNLIFRETCWFHQHYAGHEIPLHRLSEAHHSYSMPVYSSDDNAKAEYYKRLTWSKRRLRKYKKWLKRPDTVRNYYSCDDDWN